MPGIQDLPCELALQVAVHLPLTDLCNVRSACKIFDQQTYDEFTARFEEFHIFPTKDALRKLAALSEVKRIASRIRHLIIYTSVDVCGMTALAFRVRGDRWGTHKCHVAFADHSTQCRDCHDLDIHFLDRDCLHKVLSPILRSLTALRITVQESCGDWAIRLYNVRGFLELHRVLSREPYSQWAFSRQPEKFFTNAIHGESYCQVIKACRDNYVTALSLDQFELWQPLQKIGSDLTNCLPRLRSISLTMETVPDIDEVIVGERLADILNLLPSLEELFITYDQGNGYGSLSLELNGHLRGLKSKLKVLQLLYTDFADGELLQILSGMKETLVNLCLCTVSLGCTRESEEERWAEFYTVLRDEFKLKRASIDILGPSVDGTESDLPRLFSEGIQKWEQRRLARKAGLLDWWNIR